MRWKNLNKSKKESAGLSYGRITLLILICFLFLYLCSFISFIYNFFPLINQYSSSNQIYSQFIEPLCEGKWSFFLQWVNFPWAYSSFLPFIGILIGLIFAFKKGNNKSLFLYPLVTMLIGCVLYFLVYSKDFSKYLNFSDPIAIIYWGVISTAFLPALASLIISTGIYYKKEKMLLISLGIILFLAVALGVILGIKTSNDCLSNEKFENVIKEAIPSMKEKAIAENNINGCVEMIDFYEGQREKIIPKYLQAPRENDAPKYDVLYDNYIGCVEKIAIASNNESLCNYIPLVQGNSKPTDMGETYKEGIRSGNSIYFINCVKRFILETYGNCGDLENEQQKEICVGKTALEKGDYETCAKIDDNQCIYDIAIKNKDSNICFFAFDTGVEDDCIEDVNRTINSPESCRIVNYYYLNRKCA